MAFQMQKISISNPVTQLCCLGLKNSNSSAGI